EAVARTEELSARLGFTLADLGYEFPRYPVPEGETITSFLRKRTDEGARQRYRPYHEKAQRQIDRELALIEKLDLAGYFLIVWDIVCYCREAGILIQGRGSAANSAVCYALGITAVDPVGMDLLFERFLSEERGEWPDIDLDLPSGDRREKVIQHVYERYGQLGAAMTANVITYRGRSAVREVGKVLDFPPEDLGRLSSLVSRFEWKDPKDTDVKAFRGAGFELAEPRIVKFLQLYRAVQDLPRHLGQHSGGMVVCQGQLDAVVPLEPASMPGRVVVQWDKDDCADMGIVKVDLLGLGMMAVLEDSITIIRDAWGEEVDLARLPADDPEVYAALQKADTVGLFQVESRAQMSCLPRLKPKSFYDIVVEVAIIRPGPIVGNMVHPYLKRRAGREAPVCLHPSLEPVLRRTLGVPLFQEQLLRMAMIAAGFSGGEAEDLRRAFGFKRSERRMKDVEVKLRLGMDRNGITGATQDAIVHSITSFALYGFPESHAASFALLAYASAWLKCRYPAAFTAAILNNQPMGFYHPATLVKDAQRHGVRIRPVDVARSQWDCTIEVEGVIRFLRLGLRYVRGLREEAGRAVVAAREKGPFAGIDDLARRVPALRKDEMATLAEAGALNFIHREAAPLHRRDTLWHAARAMRPPGEMFSASLQDEGPSPLAPMTPDERLEADYRDTGLTIGPHPMSPRREELRGRGVLRAVDLLRLPDGLHVKAAGAVICRQRPGTAKGFLFLSLEDETGIANAIVTPDLFDANRGVLVDEPFIIVEGTLQNQDGVVSVKVQRVEPCPRGVAVPSHDFH
ncbi:MAG: error-prone DNA polymerase, partial [Acidobacteria bacterium]